MLTHEIVTELIKEAINLMPHVEVQLSTISRVGKAAEALRYDKLDMAVALLKTTGLNLHFPEAAGKLLIGPWIQPKDLDPC